MSGLKTSRVRFETLFLTVTLLIGSYLRLWKIRDYMTFLGDEGRDVLVVKRMLVDFDIPFIGPTASVGGFFLGPIYYYFMAPFLALFRLDPVGPAVMVALVGIGTIYLVYRFGKEFFSREAGLIAALLYAVSPIVIAQSRSSWNPNIVPFFSLLYIYGLWKAVATHSRWWYLIVGLCIGIGIQLHYLFTFLIPVGMIYVLLYDRGIQQVKNYLISAIGAFSVLIPFLGFEIKNGFINTRTLFSYVFQSEEVMYGDAKAVEIVQDVIFRLFGRLIFLFPPHEQLEFLDDSMIAYWSLLITIAVILSLGYVLVSITINRTKKNVLIVLWLLFGIGLFSLYQKQIYDYYFVILFTVPFLLLGNFFGLLWKNRFLKLGVVVLVALLFLVNWEKRPFKSPPNRQVNQVQQIAQRVFDEADHKPYNFALITTGNSDHAYRYFLEIWGNPPVTIENFQIDPNRSTVTHELFVVCEYKDCQPLGNPLWEVAGFGQSEIAGKWDFSAVVVYKLVAYEDEMIQ